MLALEPVPALTSMLFALKMAKLSDEPLSGQIAALESRTRQTKSADSAGWAAIYRDALALIPQAVAAQQRQEQERQQAAGQQAARQRVASLASVVPQKLQRAFQDWSDRLKGQSNELRDKSQRAALKLDIKATDDEQRGETVYQVDDAQLKGFWDWVASADARWRENNGQLVAVRANELLDNLKTDLPAGVSFEVRPVDLPASSGSLPRLNGHRIPTPSRFEALGTTYKTVMGAVMGVSSIGFLATKLAGSDAAALLPWLFGAVFSLAIIYAAVTVPKQYRQSMARRKDEAAERVRNELVAAAKERIEQCAAAQLIAIKKHLLQAEDQRWARLVHDATGGSNPGLGGLGPLGGMAPIGGLTPQLIGQLQGEWRDALAARLAQLEGAA